MDNIKTGKIIKILDLRDWKEPLSFYDICEAYNPLIGGDSGEKRNAILLTEKQKREYLRLITPPDAEVVDDRDVYFYRGTPIGCRIDKLFEFLDKHK